MRFDWIKEKTPWIRLVTFSLFPYFHYSVVIYNVLVLFCFIHSSICFFFVLLFNLFYFWIFYERKVFCWFKRISSFLFRRPRDVCFRVVKSAHDRSHFCITIESSSFVDWFALQNRIESNLAKDHNIYPIFILILNCVRAKCHITFVTG